jgi:hypothetical protein
MRRTQKAGPGLAAQSQELDPLTHRPPAARYSTMEGLARFGLASPSIILSRDAVCGTSGAGWRLTFTVEAIWGSILFMSPDSKPALSAPTGSKNDPKPGKNGNSGRPLFPKSHLPVFSLLFAFEEII